MIRNSERLLAPLICKGARGGDCAHGTALSSRRQDSCAFWFLCLAEGDHWQESIRQEERGWGIYPPLFLPPCFLIWLDFSVAVVLKVWSLPQGPQNHLGTFYKCKFFCHALGPPRDLLNHKLWGWDPATCVLTTPLDDSDAHGYLKTTGLGNKDRILISHGPCGQSSSCSGLEVSFNLS